MSEPRHSLDIKRIHESATAKNLEGLSEIDIALQSIGKRLDYCWYHYVELTKESEQKWLMLGSVGRITNRDGIDRRTVFEANIYSFLHNLHGLVDSFPFLIHSLVPPATPMKQSRIGWNKEFLKQYKTESFYQTLDDILKSDTFSKLKGYANKTKHQRLVRIRNTGDKLYFEDMTFKVGSKVVELKEVEVQEFLISCHDYLVPLVVKCGNEILEHLEQGV